MTVTSALAVFREVDGGLEYLAPAGHVPASGLAAVDLPADFVEDRWRWETAARAFVVDLDALRAERWTLVKAARDRAEWGGCTTGLGRMDTDPDSQRKLSGAVQMAMIAQAAGTAFAIDWTMQDNSSVVHDALAMIAAGVAVGQHVAACHAAALVKRAEIDAADSAAAIEAVDTDGGWPDAQAA